MTSLIGVVLDLVHGLEGQVVVLDLLPGMEVVVVDPDVLDLHFVLHLAIVLEGLVVQLVHQRICTLQAVSVQVVYYLP